MCSRALRFAPFLAPLALVAGLSAAPRLVALTIEVDEPMGGEVYVSGGNLTIEWTISLEAGDPTPYVSLYYIWAGETERHYIADVTTDVLDGSYTWRGVPAVTEMSYLRVEANAVALDVGLLDRNASPHVKLIPNRDYPSIYLTSPQPVCNAYDADCATPIEYEVGSIALIRWTTTGCAPPNTSVPLTVRFSSNGGMTYSTIGTISNPCAMPLMAWTVPNVETTRGVIRVDWGGLDWSASAHTFAISEAPPPPNHPPVADAGDDLRVSEGARVELDGTGSSDPDVGDTITYRWRQTDGLTAYQVVLSGATTATPSFDAPALTLDDVRLEFTLTVTDSHGATDSDSVFVTVTAGGPGITTFSPREGWEKTPITLEGRNLSGCQIRMHGTVVDTIPTSGFDTRYVFYLPGGLPTSATRITVTGDTGTAVSAAEFTVLREPYQWDWCFGFHNQIVPTMSWADYDRAFGHSVYLWVLGIPICCDRCARQCHDPIAQLLYDYYYRDMGQDGVCWGMCSQTLKYYFAEEPWPYATPIRDWPFDLSPETEIARRVKRDHIRQISGEIIRHLLEHYRDRPMEVLAQVQAATSRTPARRGILGIVALSPGALTGIAGHAIVPDRVVQMSSNEWRIYVYDPNRESFSMARDITDPAEYPRLTDPDSYPYVEVTRAGDLESWRFVMAGGAVWEGNTSLSIDVSISGETFIEIPYSGFTYYPEGLVLGPHHLPTSPEGLFTIFFGAADGGIDRGKERIGHDRQGRLYLQIPDAVPVVPMIGPAYETEAYALPSDDYRITMYGREVGTYEWMAIEERGSVGLSEVQVTGRSEDTIELPEGARSFRLETGDATKSYSARILRAVGSGKDLVWRQFEVLGTTISSGDAAVFRTRGDAELVYENHGTHAVVFKGRLGLTSLGPQPEPPDQPPAMVAEETVTLEVPEVRLPAGRAMVLRPSSWDDLGGAVPRISIVPISSLEQAFIRGDANADGVADISDAITVLGHLFLGSPTTLACQKAADIDDGGSLNITDAIYLLGFRFLGGPAPPAPYPSCGDDPTADDLGCDSFGPCDAR